MFPLRSLCRFLGVTQGVMQRGHMRFEPNINLEMELEDGTGPSSELSKPEEES